MQLRATLLLLSILQLFLAPSSANRRRQNRQNQNEEYSHPEVEVSDYEEQFEEGEDQYPNDRNTRHQRQKERREREKLELQQDEYKQRIRHKLLIIVLDGFRWDYLDIFESRTGERLEGFRQFQSEGVSAEYLESVFPAESFPAWQTLQTGLYPEHHDILGNQFYDPEVHQQKPQYSDRAFFNIEDQRATQNMLWWQKDEPIWATAKKQNVSFSAYNWARCDIPFDTETRLRFEYCENLYAKDRTKTLRINVDKALAKFQIGVDAAIIYEDALERTAEEFGPLSLAMETKTRELDEGVKHLANRLNVTSMEDIVNVVILSDHGMAYASSPVKKLHPDDFNLDEYEVRKIQLFDSISRAQIRWIVGSGSHAAVYPNNKKDREAIIETMQGIEGIEVYDKKDIPERFHYKRSKNTPPILVVAKPGTVILSSYSEIQRPAYRRAGKGLHADRLMEQTKMGVSGYDPELPDMRGILMAKGPDFKNTGEVLPPVKLVDLYELFCKVLGIDPRQNDGSLANVLAFLRGGSIWSKSNLQLLLLSLLVTLLANIVL